MRRSTFCIGVSKPFGCNEKSVGRHTQKPKPSGLGAVTATASHDLAGSFPSYDAGLTE
jgi:hypothetical protein